MAKNVQIKPGFQQAALVAIGWVAFFLGALVNDLTPVGSTLLMAIARVLP